MTSFRYFSILVAILAILLSNTQVTFAADTKPSISSSVIKKNSEKSCSDKGTYLGPNNVNDHWGTCIKVSGIRVLSEYVLTRSKCKGDWVYIGPNRANVHGGYCAKLDSEKWMLKAVVERENKNCGKGKVYAGANNVKAHWGHCLSIVKNGSWTPPTITDKEAIQDSEEWECVRPDRTKSKGKCPGDTINITLPASNTKLGIKESIKFDNWRGLKKESPCSQDSKNRIAKYITNTNNHFIKAQVSYKKYTEDDSFKKYSKTVELDGGQRKFFTCVDHLNQSSQHVKKVWDKSGNLLSQ